MLRLGPSMMYILAYIAYNDNTNTAKIGFGLVAELLESN